ncbi:hypothetical protein C8Q74DRAFT_872805 [Fomes fomentarius]|nr:hypothetical protein C8Q74DRAFT_872805 [Fomes fomentarius]
MDPSGRLGTSATYCAPVQGCKPGHVFTFSDPLLALLELQRCPTYVQRLTLGPISPSSFPSIQDTLIAFHHPFGTLEELNIAVSHPPGGPRPKDVPKLILSAEKFPSLRILRLEGVSMDWKSEIFKQLTHVQLLNCPATTITDLVDFIGTLPKWTSLAELRLGNFLSNPMLDTTSLDTLEGGYYSRPVELRTLIVDDFVHQIPPLLYHLDVPGPGAHMHIVGDPSNLEADDDRSPFEAMMPFDSNLPAIFKDATSVELTVDPAQATLIGVSPVGTLTLDVPQLAQNTPDVLARTFRSAFLALVNIFAARSAPVQSLTLNGDISQVSASDWDTVLQNVCPWLHKLNVYDIGTGARSTELFEALVRPFSNNELKPVCPDLQKIAYSGRIDASPNLLHSASCALLHRRSLDIPLRAFSICLITEECADWTPAEIENTVQTLKQWVSDKVEVLATPLQPLWTAGMVVEA